LKTLVLALVWTVIVPASLCWLCAILFMFALLVFGLGLRELGSWIAGAGYLLRDACEDAGELLDMKIQEITGDQKS
jgi:hypothetical protein